MNTFVRAIPQQHFAARANAQRGFLYKQMLQIFVLIFAVLLSAFSVVYVKDLHRRMFIAYQDLQQQQTQLYVDWGKLLLEQSTWSTQARVQKIAQQRLGMEAPQTKDIVLVD